jgi:hypothetical protein
LEWLFQRTEKLRKIATYGLVGFLEANSKNTDILYVVISCCYANSSSANDYFAALVQFVKERERSLPLALLLNLALFKCGDSSVEVRHQALVLLQLLTPPSQLNRSAVNEHQMEFNLPSSAKASVTHVDSSGSLVRPFGDSVGRSVTHVDSNSSIARSITHAADSSSSIARSVTHVDSSGSIHRPLSHADSSNSRISTAYDNHETDELTDTDQKTTIVEDEYNEDESRQLIFQFSHAFELESSLNDSYKKAQVSHSSKKRE